MVEFDDLPLLFGNHFLVQHQPDEFVVTVGQLTAPPLVSPSDRTGGQSEVPIQTLTRIGLTRNRVAELIALPGERRGAQSRTLAGDSTLA